MHDPLVVAFTIRRPWPSKPRRTRTGAPRWKLTVHGRGARRFLRPGNWSPFATIAGREFYWPALVTIWHREPGGRDSGEVCKHYHRWHDADGAWNAKPRRAWRWHVHHWHIQITPTQKLKRWLWTRCAECGRRLPYGYSPVSHQWDGDGPRWFRGETHTYHHECSNLVTLRRSRATDEDVIRWLVAELRGETNETEIEVLERLTDPSRIEGPGFTDKFHVRHRLVGLFPYERDGNYRLVKKGSGA